MQSNTAASTPLRHWTHIPARIASPKIDDPGRDQSFIWMARAKATIQLTATRPIASCTRPGMRDRGVELFPTALLDLCDLKRYLLGTVCHPLSALLLKAELLMKVSRCFVGRNKIVLAGNQRNRVGPGIAKYIFV